MDSALPEMSASVEKGTQVPTAHKYAKTKEGKRRGNGEETERR